MIAFGPVLGLLLSILHFKLSRRRIANDRFPSKSSIARSAERLLSTRLEDLLNGYAGRRTDIQTDPFPRFMLATVSSGQDGMGTAQVPSNLAVEIAAIEQAGGSWRRSIARVTTRTL